MLTNTLVNAPHFAVVAALQEEVSHILEHMKVRVCETVAGRKFWIATYHGHEIVVVLSGIGKVAAAVTTSVLVERFGVTEILFTGVAGSLTKTVSVGDVVIGRELLQHDMDATPLFPRYVVPGHAEPYFYACPQMSARLLQATKSVLTQLDQLVSAEVFDRFNLKNSQAHQGLVLSGDQFVSSEVVREGLRQAHPQALVVEMEGAALAQVCKDFGVRFALMRTVSDAAGEHAAQDFSAFLNSVASRYSALIVEAYLSQSDE
jgi:adenosylhomocysteine nucleosidase